MIAIVTGSSRGIGYATAELLAREGYLVVLNGRDEPRLQAAVAQLTALGLRAEGFAGDLANPAVAQQLIETVVAKHGRLDVLVNNAGLSMRGTFEQLSPQVFQEILSANVINAMNCTRFALPHLQAVKGSVVFVSSVVGLRALPGTSVYSAAKMALTGLAEALRIEQKQRVHVGIVYVGYTQNAPDKTMMNAQGKMVPLQPRKGGVADSPEGVARLILSNIRQRKFKTVHSLPGKLTNTANRFLPRLVERAFSYLYRRKPQLFE